MSKDEVFHAIVEDILAARLKEGEPLVERTLAFRYGLSRTPIREVLLRLQREYLVEFYPNQGAFVRKLSTQDIRELFQLREAIEPLAASLAAEHRPDNAIEDLVSRLPSLAEAEVLTAQQLRRHGEAIHDAIIDWAQNRMLQDIYEILRKHTRLLRSRTRTERQVEHGSYGEHLEVLAAIRARDVSLAHRLMLEHIKRSNAINLAITT